jgi:A/G-specific adenine glycosylase
VRHATLAIVRDAAGAVLLETRPPAGIWGGLVSLPEFDGEVGQDALPSRVALRCGCAVQPLGRMPPLRHEFSHYSLVMHPWLFRLDGRRGIVAEGPVLWADAAAAAQCGLPAPIRRLLAEVYSLP